MADMLIPRSVRFSHEDWQAIDAAAQTFGLESLVFLRRIVLKALKDLEPEIAKRRQNPLPF